MKPGWSCDHKRTSNQPREPNAAMYAPASGHSWPTVPIRSGGYPPPYLPWPATGRWGPASPKTQVRRPRKAQLYWKTSLAYIGRVLAACRPPFCIGGFMRFPLGGETPSNFHLPLQATAGRLSTVAAAKHNLNPMHHGGDEDNAADVLVLETAVIAFVCKIRTTAALTM